MDVRTIRSGQFVSFHITTEAAPIFDPNGQLDQIKNNFVFKESYNNEVEIAVRIMAAVESLNEDEFSDKIRTRYFWELRTAIMASAANERLPIFSAKGLAKFFQVEGLATHIQSREFATMNECWSFGRKIIARFNEISKNINFEDESENILALFDFGGVASATAGDIVYGS